MKGERSGFTETHTAPRRIYFTEYVGIADLALGSLRAAPPATR